MSLKNIIDLYRYLNKPVYDSNNRRFSFNGSYTNPLRGKLSKIDFNSKFIQDADFAINGDFVNIDDGFPNCKKNDSIEFTIKLAPDGLIAFHLSWADFIYAANYELIKCNYPEEFYIVEDDYYSKEVGTNITDLKLKKLVELVNCLSSQAESTYFEEKFLCLVYFCKSEEGIVDKMLLKINFNNPTLLVDEIDSVIFTELFLRESEDLLINEKKNIFLTTLIDFLRPRQEEKRFISLVTEIKKFRELFLNNLKLYFDKFSFQKIRQEVANAEIDFSEKCSKTLSDIQAKLLGIPISLAGVIAIFNSKDKYEILMLFIGITFTSLILTSTVKVQLNNLNAIKSASKNVFDGFINRYLSCPETLRDMIVNEKRMLDEQQKEISMWLHLFFILSLSPFVLSLIFIIVIYIPRIFFLYS